MAEEIYRVFNDWKIIKLPVPVSVKDEGKCHEIKLSVDAFYTTVPIDMGMDSFGVIKIKPTVEVQKEYGNNPFYINLLELGIEIPWSLEKLMFNWDLTKAMVTREAIALFDETCEVIEEFAKSQADMDSDAQKKDPEWVTEKS